MPKSMKLMITRSFEGKCTQCKQLKTIEYRNEKAKSYCKDCVNNLVLAPQLANSRSNFKNKLSNKLSRNLTNNYLNSTPSEKVHLPYTDAPKKSRSRKTRSSKTKKIFGKHKGTSQELLMYRITVELEKKFLTVKEMLPKLEGYTDSYYRVSCLMGQMKSKGILDGVYLGKRKDMTYFLPEDREKFGKTVNILFKHDVPKILAEKGSTTMADIIKIVNRPRPTVSGWIKQLIAENIVEWETIKIKGKHGMFKLISLKSAPE